jgi:hypothetical protein
MNPNWRAFSLMDCLSVVVKLFKKRPEGFVIQAYFSSKPHRTGVRRKCRDGT